MDGDRDAARGQAVPHNATEIAFSGDADGLLDWVSPALPLVLGWQPSELLGRHLSTLVHPDDVPLAADWRERLLAQPLHSGTRPGTSDPVRLRRADGAYVWCRVTVVGHREQTGELTAISGTVHDVDDLVRARIAAADAAAKLHAVLDAEIDPHVTLSAIRDDDGEITDFAIDDANAPAGAYYGLRPDDMIGATIRAVEGAEVGAADVRRCIEVLRSRNAVIENDTPSDVRESRGEQPAWVDIRIIPVDDDRVLFTWRDVTDRHLAREQVTSAHDLLRAVLDSQVEPHVVFRAVRDSEGRIVDFVYEDANDAASEFEGMPRARLVGSTIREVYSDPDEAADDIAECREVLATGVRVVSDRVEAPAYPDADGRPRVVDIRIVRIDAERVSYTWRDMTDVHRAQERLVAAQEELNFSNGLLRAVIDLHVDPHVLLAAVRDRTGAIVDFRYEDANAAAVAYEGQTRDRMIGETLRSIYRSEQEADEDVQDCIRALATGAPVARNDSRTLGYTDEQGRQVFVDIRVVPVGPDLVLYTWRDVTARHLVQEQVARSEERFRLLAQNMSDVVVLIQSGLVTWVSPSITRATGWAPAEIIGTGPAEYIHPDDRADVVTAWADTSGDDLPRRRYRFRAKDGSYHWVDVEASSIEGAVTRTLVLSARVVDAEMAALRALERRARHDELTGLVNRHEVFELLDRSVTGTRRTGDRVALVFCDLDGFKTVNDDQGHAAGDDLLRQVGGRLQDAVRAGDVVARIGGDEFLVVLNGVQGLDSALRIADKLRAVIADPINLADAVVSVGASLGVALIEPGETVDAVMARADDAMYLAKRRGKNAVVALPGAGATATGPVPPVP